MNKIELRDVSVTYGVGTPFRQEALRGVSCGFEAGKITGIIGRTGSGKSTLAGLLNGLLRPDSGSVLLDGVNIWDKPKQISAIRTRVGLVMQYPEYQLFDDTVSSDIGFALRNMHMDEKETEARVREVAEFVGLPESMLGISPFDLSGGYKRRAAIAGILAMHPEVLVLDEPAAGLDPRGRREILGGLSRYRDRYGATVILVSHSMEDMAHYCENVVVMRDGEVFDTGTTEEVFSRPERLAEAGLDIPEIARLTSALIARGVPLSGKLYTVEGTLSALLSLFGKEAGQ